MDVRDRVPRRGGAAGAVLLYYFVDFGQLGPIPRMYDPQWYTDKTISFTGEAVATIGALIGFFTVHRKEPVESRSAGAPVG